MACPCREDGRRYPGDHAGDRATADASDDIRGFSSAVWRMILARLRGA
jgi:hypothetical protein